jgi:flagellar basal-body rod protein FlgB
MFGMNPGDIPLFSMLRGRLSYLTERQKVLSQNIANSNTPGFVPKDLKAFSFQAQVDEQTKQAQATTQAGHMKLSGARTEAAAMWKPVNTPDSEASLDGNGVVLEEQMIKMTDARMSYDAAIGFYQKSMDLLKMAVRAPGR